MKYLGDFIIYEINIKKTTHDKIMWLGSIDMLSYNCESTIDNESY